MHSRDLLLTILEVEECRIKVPAHLVSGEVSSWLVFSVASPGFLYNGTNLLH